MKAVQVGILAALLLCAGLLFKVYRGQQTAAPPAPATAAPASTPSDPSATAATPQAEPSAAPLPAEPAKKPSPWRETKKSGQKIAANRPPELISPAAANAPATPATDPAPAQEKVTPVLNPPPSTPQAPPPPREPQRVTIPAGSVITVRLAETLSSEKNQPGDAFTATLDQPLVVDGFAIAERGARVQGKIIDAERSGRVKGVARLSLQLLKLHTSDGQDIALSTEKFAKQAETSHGSDAKKVGIGAALGAAIGAIAGGGKGAAIGAGVGGAAGAGTVAATRGKAAELPVETRLTFRLQEAVTVTERIR